MAGLGASGASNPIGIRMLHNRESDLSTGSPAEPGDAIDPQWLSDTIGAIYDCVLAPEKWQPALAAITTRFSFVSAVLGVFQMAPGKHRLSVLHGFDQAWIDTGDTYAGDSIGLWGGAAQIAAYVLDEPVVNSEIVSPAQTAGYAYFRDILEPRGLVDAVMLPLAREPGLIGYLALNRHRSTLPIRAAEVDGLRLLAPHLRRAVTISDLFDLKSVERATFRSVLDAMNCAVVLVDEGLGVVHSNRTADTMLADGDFIGVSQGRLGIAGRLAQEALQATVRLSAADEAQLAQRGIGLPVQSREGAPGVLHVMPLQRGEIRPGLVQRAVAAVFVVPASQNPSVPLDAISMLYDLTPAERHVFAAIAGGQTPADIAGAIGIAKSTVRTHLLRVFEKTGSKRQAELVALAARMSLPI